MKKVPNTPGLTKGRVAALEALRAQPDPVGIEALAHATAKHTNTVREQVTWLVEHGYVERIRQPSEARGRPAWLYQARGPRPGEGEYVELAAALAWRLQDSSPESLDEARETGRVWGAELVEERELPGAPGPATGRRSTVDLLDEHGYEPQSDADHTDVTLHRCPLLQAAHRFQSVVCSAHLGVIQAALEHGGADPEGAELRPFSAPGQCHLLLHADGSWQEGRDGESAHPA